MTFPKVSEILPFEDGLRVFQMPEVRFIGKSVRSALEADQNPCPGFWTQLYADGSGALLDALPHVIPHMMAIYHSYTPETSEFSYMVCAATPAGTPVPEGFEHRDRARSLVAHGITNAGGRDPNALAVWDAELAKMGLVRGDEFGEFYPDPDAATWCILFPCARME